MTCSASADHSFFRLSGPKLRTVGIGRKAVTRQPALLYTGRSVRRFARGDGTLVVGPASIADAGPRSTRRSGVAVSPFTNASGPPPVADRRSVGLHYRHMHVNALVSRDVLINLRSTAAFGSGSGPGRPVFRFWTKASASWGRSSRSEVHGCADVAGHPFPVSRSSLSRVGSLSGEPVSFGLDRRTIEYRRRRRSYVGGNRPFPSPVTGR